MAFDTLKAAQRLRDGGADEPLAEAVVDVISDATAELLTREYFDQRMDQIDGRFGQLDDRMTAREQSLDSRMDGHFAQLDDRMTVREQSLDSRMDARFEAFRAEMYRMFAIQGGVILGGVGVIVALVETLN